MPETQTAAQISYGTGVEEFNVDGVQLPNGNILAAWENNTTETSNNGRLRASISTDNGQTWGTSYTLQDTSNLRDEEAQFLVLNGTTYFFYTTLDESQSPRVSHVYYKTSNDNAITWSAATEIPFGGGAVYVTNISNPIIKQFAPNAGRIILPINANNGTYFYPTSLYSDDNGTTWQRGGNATISSANYVEPTIVELSNGNLLMYMRRNSGGLWQFKATSTDGGATWGPVTQTDRQSPAHQSKLLRLQDGKIALLWNNVSSATGLPRTPLSAAVSTDDGATWGTPINIREDVPGMFDNMGFIQLSNGNIMALFSDETNYLSNQYIIDSTVFPETSLTAQNPKWLEQVKNGTAVTTSSSDGLWTFTASSSAVTQPYAFYESTTAFSAPAILETRMRDYTSVDYPSMFGFGVYNTVSPGAGVEKMIYSSNKYEWATSTDSAHLSSAGSGHSSDNSYHNWKIVWTSGQANFYVDGSSQGTITTNVPGSSLKVSIGQPGSGNANNVVKGSYDWLFLRSYATVEPIISVGSETNASYSSANPAIQPNSSKPFSALSGFTETATKNGGQIKYQLSNDSGTTWYWYNSGWTTTTSGYTEANTATDINANISTFPVGSGSFFFKAYLNSDGTQFVQLDSVGLTYVNIFNDTTAPAGGSIIYIDGWLTTASVSLTVSDGTDSESGINTSTRIVQRKSATLSTNGTCGSYGSFATITPTGTYPYFTDTTVISGNCYQYQYLVSDNARNQVTYTSSKATKVDTTSWYNSSWLYRKKITIDHTKVADVATPSATYANFPVLVSLDALSNINANGTDIRFTSSDGITELPREIESYSSGSLRAWVKTTLTKDSSDSTDDIIYMYYGNAAATEPAANSTYGSQNVWKSTGDTSTVMVQHLKENPSGTAPQMIDSTSNANNATSSGAMTTADQIAGQIDGSLHFDGTDDYVDAGNGASLNITSAITVEAWVKGNDQYSKVIISKYSATTNRVFFLGTGTSSTGKFYVVLSSNGSTVSKNYQSSITALDNTFHHIAFTFNNNDLELYVDGVRDTSPTKTTDLSISSLFSSPTTKDTIGASFTSGSPVNFFNGTIDEVRILNRALSTQEITTQYNNQNSPSTFYALGSEESSLDHLTITGTGTMTAGASQVITVTAITNLGATYTGYSGDKSLTFSGANAYFGGSSPTCSDKTGADIPFGTATTVTFTSGVATCSLKLYKVESASITATDGTYNANSNSLAVTVTDTTAPAVGSITYTDGYHTTESVSLTTSDGIDAGSGINTSTRTVQRKSATLSNGACGSYGSFATIMPTGTYPNFTDSTVVFGNCYQYQYLVSDNAGNQATYTSLSVAKVTTPGPASTVTDNSTAPPTCGNTPPSSAPSLYAASAQDSSSVLLYFTDAGDPVSSYAVEYGTKPGNYQYSALSIGTKGTRTYLVASLLPATTYYFRVRGGNGCAPGSWSNEISAKTKGLISFNQLDITRSELESKPAEETPPTTACKTYTVKSGDGLWSIAQNLLGDGDKYKEIIEQNKNKYPSLETSNNLEAGWELKVNCGKQISTGGTQKALAQGGYDVKIKVVDTNKKPVQGAKVTIHSKVQETVTNKDGIAQFKNVEAGDHKVLIAYNNFEGEQSVNLTGDVKEFDLNVTVQQKAISLSPLAYGIVGVMGLVVIVLAVLLIKAKRKK